MSLQAKFLALFLIEQGEKKSIMVKVVLKNRRGEKIPVEKGLKILKRKMETEGIFDELKERRHFVSPSEKRREAEKRGKNAQKRRQQQNNG